MRHRISKLIFRYKKHRLSVWSSVGLLIFGVTVLVLWLFNIPLFLQFVGYVATVYYVVDVEAGLAEELLTGKANDRLSQSDQLTLRVIQFIVGILGIAEIGLLIYFQIHQYYHFTMTAIFYTGLYFAYWSFNYLIGTYQMKRNINVSIKKIMMLNLVVMLVMNTILALAYWKNMWLFISVVILAAVIEWIISWQNYYVAKNGDKNDMGY